MPAPLKVVDEFPRPVIEFPDVGIVMPDGCRLSARIWMPADATEHPVPAILEHLPYRKRDGTIVRDQLTHPYFAGHGYASIRVDMRGNGDSQGLMEDEYTPQELQDACNVIAWAASQPWCSGTVGMMGISWGGFNALQVAALRPPALKAIITLCSTVDRFADDIHYKGGCLLGENFGWAANMLSYSSRPPDPDLVGERWRAMWLERLDNMPFLARTWLGRQVRDDYWKHGSVCEDYSAIEAAVLSIGGWHDGYRNTIAHLVENISAPVKGIVGPWIHKYPHYAGPEPRIGFLQEALRWWDRWLKDQPTGVENDPAYRAYLMDSVKPARWLDTRPGRWIAEAQWPSPGIVATHYHLGRGSRSRGTLCDEPAQISVAVRSSELCGAMGGEYFPFCFGPELPDLQNSDDDLSACFDGTPLAAPIDIVGAPQLTITGTSDKPRAQLAVRLCDIAPDGTSALITLGLLNLTHRSSSEAPELLAPGELFSASVTLDQIAYRIPAGHRLRIAISTTYWPFIWPAPDAATITLLSGQLALPQRRRSADGDEWQFPPAEGAKPWAAENLRPASSERRMKHNSETGRTEITVENDFGEDRDLDHGLRSGSRTREVWSIAPDDPLSARVDICWEQTGGRGPWSTRTRAEMTMTCDAEHFYLNGELTAWENDTLFHTRTWRERVPRRFV